MFIYLKGEILCKQECCGYLQYLEIQTLFSVGFIVLFQKKLNKMNKYILLIVLTLVLFSCRKERGLYDCSDNCKTYEIKGRIFDPISSKAFANYPVKLRWVTFRGNCIFCPRKQRDIYNGKTDRNGNFSVVVNLDTTLFQDYSVVFSTPEKEHYRNVYHGYLEDENLRGKPIEVPFYP